MKQLVALAAIIFSLSSFAIDQNSSWKEIRAEVKRNHKLIIKGDWVFLGFSTSAFNVCTDGENFNSTIEFPIYEYTRRRGGSDDRYERTIVGYEYKSYPLVYTTRDQVCRGSRDNNCRWVERTVRQTTVKKIKVMKEVRRQGRDRDPVYKTLFTKTYEIPSCN